MTFDAAGTNELIFRNDKKIKEIPIPEQLDNDPLLHIEVLEPVDEEYTEITGLKTSGWYFNNETWSFVYGPYGSRGDAERACCEYARHL